MYFNFSYLLLIHLFFFVCFLNWLYLSLSSPCAASILIPYKVSLLSVLKFFICCLFPILFCEALCNFVWKEKKTFLYIAMTYPLYSAFCTLTHCSTCSRVLLLWACFCVLLAGGSGALWYVPAAMPLGSSMGLGVETRPFLVQMLEGKVEAARDGARDGTLDTGAEAEMWSGCGTAEGAGLDGREVCVSISRPVLPMGGSNMMVAGESLWKLQRSSASRCMGSRRTSWIICLVVSESKVLVLWWLIWFVCGTACCDNLSAGLWRVEMAKINECCHFTLLYP